MTSTLLQAQQKITALENRLAVAEIRLQVAIDSTDEGILMVDQNGKVLSVNKRFIELWHVPQTMVGSGDDDRLIAHVLDQLIDPDQFQAKIRQLYGSNAEARDTLQFKDGRVFIRYSRAFEQDHQQSRIWCFKDITEQTVTQTALAEREQRFRSIFESSPDPVWIMNAHRFVECNPAAVAVFGYRDREAFLNVHPSEISPPHQLDGEDSFTKAERMMTIADVDGVNRFEWLHKRVDGTEFFAEVTLAAIDLSYGRGIYAVVRDITQRVQTEKALNLENEKNLALLRSSSDGIHVLDADGFLIEASNSFCTMMGYAREEILGQHVSRWETSFTGDVLEQKIRQSFESKTRSQFEARHQRKDGSIFDVEISVLFSLLQGNPVLFSSSRDITERKKTEAALKASERQLLLITNNMPGPVSRVDRNLRYLFANDVYERVYGKSRQEIMGKSIRDVIGQVQFKHIEPYTHRVLSGEQVSFEAELKLPSGETIFGMTHFTPDRDAQGSVTGFFIVGYDITPLKRAEAGFRQAESTAERDRLRFLTILKTAGDGIHILNTEGLLVEANEAFLDMLGYDHSAIGKAEVTDWDVKLPAHEIKKNISNMISSREKLIIETCHKRSDGGVIDVEINMSGIEIEGIGYLYASSRDITDRKRAEAHISHLAYRDSLTGLPNRTLLRDRVEQSIANAHRDKGTLALLFLDLDHFKNINDSLGHAAGDAMLTEVATKLSLAIRQVDTIGRLGGDEFLVLLPNTNADAAAHVAQKIIADSKNPFVIESRSLSITPSIGIAIYPKDGISFDDLLKAADIAMYRAKEDGRNTFRFYAEEMNQAVFQRMVLESNLHCAISNSEFFLHYQPKFDLNKQTMVGMEALLRWHQPELGLISPSQFIPVAEVSGLIDEIGKWVLDTACRQIRAWMDEGLHPPRVAVNFSARQFVARNIVETVANTLQVMGLSGNALQVEITESLLAQDMEYTMQALHALQKMGVHIAVDDFGTGYSSLSYLKRFSINQLKIDQSFIRDLETDADGRAIAMAIVTLGHTLGLRVIAEGVETRQQMEILREMGCDETQGFYLGRPMPAKEMTKLLRQQSVTSC